MGLIGKLKGISSKVGKLNPRAIVRKVGKISHNVVNTAKNVMSKAENIGKKIGDAPVIGGYAKKLYKAPIFKGASLQMLHKGSKTALNVADKGLKVLDKYAEKIPEGNVSSIVKKQFSNKASTNIGNTHIASKMNSAKKLNELVSSNKQPVIKARNTAMSKHIQAVNIMKSTPIRQVPKTVVRVVRGGLG